MPEFDWFYLFLIVALVALSFSSTLGDNGKRSCRAQAVEHVSAQVAEELCR